MLNIHIYAIPTEIRESYMLLISIAVLLVLSLVV